MSRHKLIGTTSNTGNDEIKFYDAGYGDIYIVHFQEWAELCSDVDDEQYDPDTNVTFRGITATHDGAVIVKLGDWRSLVLCIAEAMHGYGSGDIVEDESGNNKRELLKSARNSF